MKYKNNITGIICVNKPAGITSRDVVNKVQKILNTKAGHTGTLDPIAHGVLVITLGKATKLNELLVATTKEYIATAILGIGTDTLDTDGTVLNNENTNFSKEEIIRALNHFKGKYEQEVPKHSAVKINGKKLYEYAREKVDIELPKRMVEVYDIELLDCNYTDNKTVFKFKVKVSKGTYIRSLIRDIGLYLNTNGVMSDLERVKQGNFSIEKSYTLDDIEKGNYKILSVGDVLKIPKVKVDDLIKFKIINGQVLNYDYDEVLFTDENGLELAIYKKEKGVLKMWKMLCEVK